MLHRKNQGTFKTFGRTRENPGVSKTYVLDLQRCHDIDS